MANKTSVLQLRRFGSLVTKEQLLVLRIFGGYGRKNAKMIEEYI